MTNPEQAQSEGETIRQQASEWLIRRRDSGSWSADDETALNGWLNQSPAHGIAYWRLEAVWNQADRLGALRQPMLKSVGERARPSAVKAVAAAALLATLAAAGSAYLLVPRSRVYETPVGGREILTLRDGSQIELNTATEIQIADRTDRREIWLDRGEAFFDVKHDERRPFVVIAGDRRIIDVGTKFAMRRGPSGLQVSVVEGSVRLDREVDNSHTASALLSAGDVATATANVLSVTKHATAVLNDELGWRRGVLVFRHTTLADAVAEFNRYNQKKLTLVNQNIGRLRIGGTFPIANIEGFADAAQEILGLHVVRREDETIISR